MEKNDMHQDKLKIYEIGYLLVPTIAEENVGTEVQTLKTLLETRGATFITEDAPKMRPLAYSMTQIIGSNHSKFDKAYFGWVKFEISPKAISAIKAEFDKNEKILRSMIIETVRENTLVSQKMVFRPGADKPKKEDGEAVEEVKVSEEELDKTIDNLVVE